MSAGSLYTFPKLTCEVSRLKSTLVDLLVPLVSQEKKRCIRLNGKSPFGGERYLLRSLFSER